MKGPECQVTQAPLTMEYKSNMPDPTFKKQKTRLYTQQHKSHTGGHWCSLDSFSAKISTVWPTDRPNDMSRHTNWRTDCQWLIELRLRYQKLQFSVILALGQCKNVLRRNRLNHSKSQKLQINNDCAISSYLFFWGPKYWQRKISKPEIIITY